VGYLRFLTGLPSGVLLFWRAFLFALSFGVMADGFFGVRTFAWCGLMLVHQGRWCWRKGAATRGGGYFFPLRRKKVTKKGATSLEEAIFFMPGGMVLQGSPCPHRDRYGSRGEYFSPATHRGEAGGGAKDLGKALGCREVRWGWLPEGCCTDDCCRTLRGNVVRLPARRGLVWRRV
jgi:hypothetical protein